MAPAPPTNRTKEGDMAAKKQDRKLVESLNRMLAQEHACAIRYATHAAVITGPYSETVAARLKEIGGDEVLHAEKLRQRILALGGTPTMEVRAEDLKPATTLDKILKVNIAEEQAAIRGYTEILETLPLSNVILFQTIQEIIRDEQEHLEELDALMHPKR
jgi:bacterioferritin